MLIVKYQAHINVEWCNQSRSIKYLYCRYVSASEACWRLFEFPIHFRKPSVQRLSFHLDGELPVVFRENERLTSVLQRTDPDGTMFIQWMLTDGRDHEARELTYVEFPERYRWLGDKRRWVKRKQKIPVVGRLYYAHPMSGERFYLRPLLNIVRGVRSYEDLKTVDEFTYQTFQKACYHRGLLELDNEWDEALQEASSHQSGKQVRELFVTLLLFCEVSDPKKLWEKHLTSMTDDDIERNQQRICNMPNLIISDSSKQALADVNQLLLKNEKSLEDYPTMPQIDRTNDFSISNRLIFEETIYNQPELAIETEALCARLNND